MPPYGSWMLVVDLFWIRDIDAALNSRTGYQLTISAPPTHLLLLPPPVALMHGRHPLTLLQQHKPSSQPSEKLCL